MMFGIFQSQLERASNKVAEFLRDNLARAGPLPVAALSDRYCLGFLQKAGMHVASQSLPKESSVKEAKAAFEYALMKLSPNRAGEAVEILPYLKSDQSFLRVSDISACETDLVA
jgi:hypothetical protein